jgi:hypothetical protein
MVVELNAIHSTTIEVQETLVNLIIQILYLKTFQFSEKKRNIQ